MTTEIQRADTRLRRTTAIVLIVAVVAAAVIFHVAQHWLLERAAASSTEDLIAQMRHWIGVAFALSAACLFALAIHAWRRARAAKAQQRWPVTAARVLRDTPVRHGAAALRVARLLHLLSLLLFVFCAATFVLSWRLFGA